MKRIRRPYQKSALVAVRKTRQLVLFWARRCRKSTTLGEIAFEEISKGPGRMVIAASASLLLGRELVGMTLTASEQGMVVFNEAVAMQEVLESGAKAKGLQVRYANSDTGKVLNGLTAGDMADLYHSSRMEVRLHFSETDYSRMQVISPNPATARSWRATVIRDEAGFTPPAFEEALRVATDPMVRDTPDLRIIYASNLSGNDRHPFFTTTLPKTISEETEEAEFPANPKGHFYFGQDGMLIHRVALKDAYAAGHALYDDDGKVMTYEECRSHPQFKLGWDETYALNHKSGGAAAIDLMALIAAQRRGIGQCHFQYVENETDFRRGLSMLEGTLRNGRTGIGFDVASTTKEKSNPSSITVTENLGGERFQRLVCVFKSRHRAVAEEYLRQVIRAVRERKAGGPAVKLCIDASNERQAAEENKKALEREINVELVLGGASVDPLPPGYRDTVNYKTYQGDLYCAAVNEGRTALPPDTYIKDDHRLVVKDAGRYLCAPDSAGRHGDTFDSGKLAEYALEERHHKMECVLI